MQPGPRDVATESTPACPQRSAHLATTAEVFSRAGAALPLGNAQHCATRKQFGETSLGHKKQLTMQHLRQGLPSFAWPPTRLAWSALLRHDANHVTIRRHLWQGTTLSSIPEKHSYCFAFTIRRDEGVPLGLRFAHDGDQHDLCVTAVQPESAIDAWNRSCIDAHCAGKQVFIGDRIMSVNDISCQPQLMLQECQQKSLLRIVLERDVSPVPLPMPCGSQQVARDPHRHYHSI